MLRLVVATYLIIVTAAGPAACCCTVTRLAARLGSSAPSSPPKPGGCCGHTPAGPGHEDKARQPGPPPSDHPNSPGCPCKQGGECEVFALPAAPDEAYESSARAATWAPFPPLAVASDHCNPALCVLPVFWGARSARPSVSADQLLYVFHMLRC